MYLVMVIKSANQYVAFLGEQRGKLSALNESKTQAVAALEQANKQAEIAAKACVVVNAVTLATLEQAKVFIEETVTLCLAIVYGDTYSLKVDYQIKRGRSEAAIRLIRDGNDLDPRLEIGGGVLDIMSFALRLVMWVLQTPRTDAVFVLDEPFRFIDNDKTSRLSEMIRELCDAFQAQFIVASHKNELAEGADKAIRVIHRGGKSVIVEE